MTDLKKIYDNTRGFIMIVLREYQNEAIELLKSAFLKHKRIILCLPTGSGKTVIFTDMVRRAYEKGTQTLIITDRIELCSQTLKAISHHNIPTQILNAETKTFYPDAPVTLAMCETIKRRMKKWDAGYYNPKFIIIDEAHKNSFNKIMDFFPNARVIGATASPESKTLHKYYTHIVDNVDIPELINLGFLSKCKAFEMQDDFSNIEIKRGEFDEGQLYSHFNKPKLYKGVIESYQSKCPNTKALVFCVNIKHVINMCEEFNKAGIVAHYVTSETPPEERQRIFKAFSQGIFKVLVNCNIATTGYDEPSIETIITNRATASTSLWLQMQGRGSRPYPNKTYFTVLDFGGNTTRHGLWNSEREWSLDPPKPKKQGVAPIKSCPQCSAMLHARAIKCEFCGYIFPLPAQSALKDGVLVEVASDNNPFEGRKISELSIHELVQLSKTKKIKTPYIWRVVRAKGYDAVQNYGWLMGYKNGWAFNQQKELNDCSFRDRIL